MAGKWWQTLRLWVTTDLSVPHLHLQSQKLHHRLGPVWKAPGLYC